MAKTVKQEVLTSITLDRRAIERALEAAARKALEEQSIEPGALTSIAFHGDGYHHEPEMDKVTVTFKKVT
jgi:hypothetical protein